MGGRIGSVHRAQDGQSYGCVVYDQQDRATQTGRRGEAQGLLVTARACVRR
jgi:hypothetical protein